jgi:hypothetical protein
LSTAIGATLLANLLCALLPTWRVEVTGRSLPELLELVSLSNLPVAICLVAWAITISAGEESDSPTKVQLATITLFFGSLFPLFTTAVHARLALTVVRRVLALF